MQRPDVRIGIQNQFPAVSMPLPLRDNLYVYPFLNCAGNKHTAETAMAVYRQI